MEIGILEFAGSVENIAGLISGGHGEGVSEGWLAPGFSVIIINYMQ